MSVIDTLATSNCELLKRKAVNVREHFTWARWTLSRKKTLKDLKAVDSHGIIPVWNRILEVRVAPDTWWGCWDFFFRRVSSACFATVWNLHRWKLLMGYLQLEMEATPKFELHGKFQQNFFNCNCMWVDSTTSPLKKGISLVFRIFDALNELIKSS